LAFWFYCFNNFKLFGFPITWLCPSVRGIVMDDTIVNY
jgi:hypothetical protein